MHYLAIEHIARLHLVTPKVSTHVATPLVRILKEIVPYIL